MFNKKSKKPAKIMFFDIEPTGDGTNIKHCILEAHFEIWEQTETVMTKVSEFYCKLRPREDVVFQARNNGYINRNKAEQYRHDITASDNRHTFRKFVAWLDCNIDYKDKNSRLIPIAYNIEFDKRLLKNWFRKNGRKDFDYFFFLWDWCLLKHAAVDMLITGEYEELKNMKLGTVCEHYNFNIDKEKTHTASYDVSLLILLWNRLVNGR